MDNASGLVKVRLEERTNVVTAFFADGTSTTTQCGDKKEAQDVYRSYASPKENWAHNRQSCELTS